MVRFPLDISAKWHQDYQVLDALHSEWLLETGSLTAKLKQEFAVFSVKVLNEKQIMLSAEQAEIVGVEKQAALCREVLLYGDGQPRIYAQSWIPLEHLEQNSTFLNLGTKPLGEFIFQHPRLQRESIMLAEIVPAPYTAELLQELKLDVTPFFARRSVFNLDEVKLMVCEAFLPGALSAQC